MNELSVPRGRGRPRAQAEILASALSLIEEGGVRGVTMEAIAERAGISKITLYRRWPSKAALLADALLTELAEVVPLDDSRPPGEAIPGHVQALAAALGGRIGHLFRSVAAECLAEPAALDAFRERYLGLRRQLATDIIARGLKDGSFAAPGRAADCHDALYGGLFYRFLFGFGRLDPASVRWLLATTLQPRPARMS